MPAIAALDTDQEGGDLDTFAHEEKQSVNVAIVPCVNDLRVPVDVLLRHRLPPLLGEPFGGCAGLVDVQVARGVLNQAVCPD